MKIIDKELEQLICWFFFQFSYPQWRTLRGMVIKTDGILIKTHNTLSGQIDVN